MSAVFFPASPEFVKKHAKQLKGAFPALPLSVAQEAIARALGFSDLHDCTSRITGNRQVRSAVDEMVDPATKIARRYTQMRALMDYASLPAYEIEGFVRRWNLTAKAPSTISNFESDYDAMDKQLTGFESGKISKKEMEECYNVFNSTGTMPSRISEGILHGPSGHKYDYFILSNERLLEMPLYLRGNASVFLDFENGANVVLSFPNAFKNYETKKTKALATLAEQQPWTYEWFTGDIAPDFNGVSLKQMSERAGQYPDEWFALSVRRVPGVSFDSPQYAIPAVQGADFVKFIESKGSLKGLELRWFKPTSHDVISRLGDLRFQPSIFESDFLLNQLGSDEVKPCEPLFGAPFKHGPMCEIEFHSMMEGPYILLSEDIEDDDGDQHLEGMGG